MPKKKRKTKEPDNLSIKGSFDDVIGVTVGIIPQNNTPQQQPPIKPKKKDK